MGSKICRVTCAPGASVTHRPGFGLKPLPGSGTYETRCLPAGKVTQPPDASDGRGRPSTVTVRAGTAALFWRA